MSMCETMSDWMPAVAAGRREWTVEEQAHLASCSECAAEWDLVKAVSHLGRDMVVDAEGLTPAVLERVRAAKVEEGRTRWVKRAVAVGGLAIAATVLLLLMPERNKGPEVPMSVVLDVPGELQLAELDDAAPAELEVVLAEFEEPAPPASSLDSPELEGLDLSQVERALRSWEDS